MAEPRRRGGLSQKSLDAGKEGRGAFTMCGGETICIDCTDVDAIYFEVQRIHYPKTHGISVDMCSKCFPTMGHNGQSGSHPIVCVTPCAGGHSRCGKLIYLRVRELTVDEWEIPVHLTFKEVRVSKPHHINGELFNLFYHSVKNEEETRVKLLVLGV